MFRFNPIDHDREIDPEVMTPEEIEAVSDDMLELEEEYMPRKPMAVGLSKEEIREVLADVREEVRGMKLPKRRVSGKKKITPAHVAKAKAILKIGKKRGRPTAEAVAKRLLAKRVLKAAGINPDKYLAGLRYNKYVKGHAKPAKKGKAKSAKKSPAKRGKKTTARMPKMTRMEALRMIAKHKRGRPGKLLDAAYKLICGK